MGCNVSTAGLSSASDDDDHPTNGDDEKYSRESEESPGVRCASQTAAGSVCSDWGEKSSRWNGSNEDADEDERNAGGDHWSVRSSKSCK